MHTVQEVMNRDLKCCSGQESLQEIAQTMRDQSCGEVLITDDEQRPVGVVTDRDIVVRLIAQGKDPLQNKAHSIMTKGMETIREEATVQECFEKMLKSNLRRLPVINAQDRCVGIISRADIDQYLEEIETSKVVKNIADATRRNAS